MYLSPYNSGGYGNTCNKATPGCIQSCLNTAGRGAFSNVQNARKRKTEMFFTNHVHFKDILRQDLSLFSKYCQEHNLQGFVRLNGTSDIDWSKIKLNKMNINIYEEFSNLIFYEYTKDWSRTSKQKNYYITYSASEHTLPEQIKNKIINGNNVAVVFQKLPLKYLGIDVLNGDETDLRPFDQKQKIVGLLAKGRAKKDNTGFVIKTINI